MSRSNTIAAFCAVVCAAVFSLTIGLTYPLLSILLEQNGHSDTTIGINASMTALGILVFSPMVPVLLKRFKGWEVVVACLVCSAFSISCMAVFQSYAAVLVLRFVLGVSDAGVFILSEAWINHFVLRRYRGRAIGIYATAVSLGFGAGPLLIAIFGVNGNTLFIIGAGLCLLIVPLVFHLRPELPRTSDENSGSILSVTMLIPMLLVAVSAFAFWDTAILALFPVYGLGSGLTQNSVAICLSACFIGNVLLQIPLGWMADVSSRRAVMVVCATLAAACSALLPAAVSSPLMLIPLIALWGATAGGVYTMSLSELGDRFTGVDLAAGSSAFVTAFGLAGLVAGPITGGAMDYFGGNAFAVILAFVFLAPAMSAVVGKRSGWAAGNQR